MCLMSPAHHPAMVCPQTMKGHFWFGRFAVKSRSRRFGAMLNVWSLSVVAFNLRVLPMMIPFSRINRLTCPLLVVASNHLPGNGCSTSTPTYYCSSVIQGLP